jgi:hypothetical protein
MLRLTLLVSAIAPAVIELGQRTKAESTTAVSVAAQPLPQCGPLAKIVDALGDRKGCP